MCAVAYSRSFFVFFCLLLCLLGNQQRALDQREGAEVDIMKRKW